MTTCLRAVLMIFLLAWQPNVVVAGQTCPVKTPPKKASPITLPCSKPVCEVAHSPSFLLMVIAPALQGNEKSKSTGGSESSSSSNILPFKMSTTDTIASLAFIVALLALIIAIRQYQHLKKVEANKITTELWKQFLDNYDILRSTFLTLKDPMKTSETDFSNVQYIRNWIDGFVMLAEHEVLNKKMIKSLGFQVPISDFMVFLQEAVDKLKIESVIGTPRASDLLLEYEGELKSCGDIINWIKNL